MASSCGEAALSCAHPVTRNFVILLPALVPTGPIKGGFALANALVRNRSVTIVALRDGSGAQARLNPAVHCISLEHAASYRAKLAAYRALLRNLGGRDRVASISLCLSADLVNRRCREYALTCASVRGNLLRNYRHDYGVVGLPLAWAHLLALRSVDHVVAMTHAMAKQVRRLTGTQPAVIGNFIDEEAIADPESHSVSGPLRFVFVGSLSSRKRPNALLRAVASLRTRGHDVSLDLVGEGALAARLRDEARQLQIDSHVRFHGFRADPLMIVRLADAFVLPSLSEGLSRACLEALHLGVPCVLRETDGNSELIQSDFNGVLFNRESELPSAMLRAAELSRSRSIRSSLLPSAFRQQHAADLYRQLMER